MHGSASPAAAERMSTAQAVVRSLAINGIDTMFCLPGVQNDPFFDALFDSQDQIRAIHARHEQGAAYMAVGAAMATGKPAAYGVVPGPGFLNTTAALATAYGTNAPVLAVIGQIPLPSLGRNLGLLHEIPDQLGVMRSLTKWAQRIHGAAEAPATVAEAFRQLQSGRPRPVGLECSMDVWAQQAPVALQGPTAGTAIPVDEDGVERAAKLLGAAKRPLIIVGGGALDAAEHVAAVADMLQAPVASHRMGRGIVDSRHPLSVVLTEAHRLWAEADVVLAVGTRLQTQQMIWGVDDAVKIVRIDIDPEEHSRLRRPDVGIVGDAASVMAHLRAVLPKHNARRSSRTDELRALKAESATKHARLAPQLAFIEVLRAELPDNGIYVEELTQIGYASRLAFPTYAPRTYISTGYQGTLGWGVAAAIGVKAARPDVPVLSVSGDGGFMFNVQELSTAVRHNIGAVFVVFNDGAFGNVMRIQKQSYGNRTIAVDLANPDFVKLADSFGMMGVRATTPDALRAALRKAFASGGPALIEVPVGEMPDPWPLLMLPKVRPAAKPAA
ncbi:thiamine pyrophosphate-dependent enzyme [Reyranella sp. CPCC 100927]|uniref:thiamine pyrophosphate-dependent enzyme n=1 Tax=Reyranella sp. CPCC 100927 TaxID=2599616 RepID=UPI0015B6AB66|nr:thiamine pyrophosphate-dependent enzyme [Reyranella sp. CPCC 100927]